MLQTPRRLDSSGLHRGSPSRSFGRGRLCLAGDLLRRCRFEGRGDSSFPGPPPSPKEWPHSQNREYRQYSPKIMDPMLPILYSLFWDMGPFFRALWRSGYRRAIRAMVNTSFNAFFRDTVGSLLQGYQAFYMRGVDLGPHTYSFGVFGLKTHSWLMEPVTSQIG